MLIILLITGFIAPLSTTMASNGNGSIQGEQVAIANNITSTLSINSDNNQDENNSTSTPNTSNNSTNTPNISDNTKQYNNTNVTPKNLTEQVRAQEQTKFQYQNMMYDTELYPKTAPFPLPLIEKVTPKELGLTIDPNQTMNTCSKPNQIAT